MKKTSISILVAKDPQYIPEQSDPLNQKFVWSYEIVIENESKDIVQLLSRYWRITDTTGRIEDVHGLGVVGQQPLIKPGKRFTYTSFCQLMTPQGTMEGYYVMQDLAEEYFEVGIPKFALSAPSAIVKAYGSRLH